MEKGPLPRLLHKERDRQGIASGQPGPGGGTAPVVDQHLGPCRRRAAPGGAGQQPGGLPAGPAQAHLALGAQGGAQGHQGLRGELLSQLTPDHTAVPKEQPAAASPVDERGGEPGPGGTLPAGPHLDPLQQDGALAGGALRPQDGPLVEDGPVFGGGRAAQDGAVEGAAVSHRRAGHEYAALHQRPAAHPGPLLQYGVGPDEAPLAQLGPRPDPARGHHRHPRRNGLGRPDAGRALGQGKVQLHPAGQGVGGAVQIGRAVPHIAPVAVGHVAVQRCASGEQQGEQVLAEVVGLVPGHQVHGPAGQQVDTGVYRVGEHLAPARLFDEPLDAPVVPGEHQAVLQGGGVAVEDQGGRRPTGAVEPQGGGQV